MTMPLKPTRLEHTYEMGDESGYRFTVVVEWKDDTESWTGWHATVTMTAHGMSTPEAAVSHLRHSAEAFLRQLDAKPESVKVGVEPMQTWREMGTGVWWRVLGPDGVVSGNWKLNDPVSDAVLSIPESVLLESYELVRGPQT